MAQMVSLLLDVEDPFNIDSDDATLAISDALGEAGVRATFCVSGLKCRVLMERNRFDVLESLKQHCLGLHTDTHSLHPTTMELLEERNWQEGLDAVLETEGRALRSFEAAFGIKPVCWGGAGNTWGPQITEAMRTLGVPAVVYSQIAVPNRHVHEFLGVLSLPTTTYLGGEDCMEDDQCAQKGLAKAIDTVEKCASPWAEVFCGHPSRYCALDFWDTPFFGGVTPDEYVPNQRRSDEGFKFCLKNLKACAIELKQRFEVLGLDDVVSKDWCFENIPTEQLDGIAKDTEARLRGSAGWPVHKKDLNPDQVVSLTLERLSTLRVAETLA